MSKFTNSTPDLQDGSMHAALIQTQHLALPSDVQAPAPIRPAEDLVRKLERRAYSAEMQSSITSNSPTIEYTLKPLSLSNRAELIKEKMSLSEGQYVIYTPDIADRSKRDAAAVVSPTEEAGIYQKKRKRPQTPSTRTWGHFAEYFLDQWIESLDSAAEFAVHGQNKSKIDETNPPKAKAHFVGYFLDQWIEHLGSATARSSTTLADSEQPQTSGKELQFQGRISS